MELRRPPIGTADGPLVLAGRRWGARAGTARRASRQGASLVTVLCALLLAVPPAGAATPPPAPGGGVGLRLVDAPSEARDDPRARVYVVDHLPPGAVIERRIQVSNRSTSPALISLYAAAAGIDDGSFVGAADRTHNELSTWTTVTPSAPVVPGSGSVTATVTIAVPADAPPGEQYGVVWAEARSAPAAGGGVTQVSRVGIRLYLSVGPGGAPASDFTIDALTAVRTEDGPTVLATVTNTGGRALDMNGTLLLSSGPGGLSAGPSPVSTGSTLPVGGTRPVSTVLDGRVPAGPWDATITLTSGLVERTATATITFPESGAAPAVATDTPGTRWPVVAVVGIAAVLLMGLAIVLRRHARRSSRRRSPTPPGGADSVDENATAPVGAGGPPR